MWEQARNLWYFYFVGLTLHCRLKCHPLGFTADLFVIFLLMYAARWNFEDEKHPHVLPMFWLVVAGCFFAFLNWTKQSRPKLPSKYNQQLTFLIDFRNSLTCASVYICLVCRESCKLSEFVLWWFLSTFKLCCQFAAVRIMDFLRNHRVNKLLNTYKSYILFNSKH